MINAFSQSRLIGNLGNESRYVAPSSSSWEPTTHHQNLQRSLSERKCGGPHEQTGSAPARLRNTRTGEIMHSSLEEPLSRYKSLESFHPRWPRAFQRYHKDNGIRVIDQDTVVVSARDQLSQTSKGLLRSSSGTITYSHSHKLKAQLDVEELAKILVDPPPGGAHFWTPKRAETAFRERTGRPGSWNHYEMGIRAFLASFPKTFLLFGPTQDFVQLVRKANSQVMDDPEDAIVRLAQAREHGYLVQALPITGAKTTKGQAVLLPELTSHRLKAAFTPYAAPGAGDTMTSDYVS